MPSLNIDAIVGKVLKMDDGDSKSQINIAVFVDETVGPELREVARRMLVPATGDVRMHIESYFDEPLTVDDRADLTIIIANASPWTGATYSVSKSKDIATVVLAERLDMVVYQSEQTQFDIDREDLLSTEIIATRLIPVRGTVESVATAGIEAVEGALNLVSRDLPKKIIGRPLVPKRIELNRPPVQTEADFEALFEALGDWVVRKCPELRETFVAAYRFALSGEASYHIRKTAFQNAVTAAIFFTPGADLPVMTLNEIKMLIQIEHAHGYGIGKETLGEVGGIVVFALVSRTLARLLANRIPLFGWVIKTAYSYVMTLLLGAVIDRYCKEGRVLPEPLQQLIARVGGLLRQVLPGKLTKGLEAAGVEG